MRVFKDVDIISALRKIVDNNTLYYPSDFKYDAETLKNAGEGRRFLWMSRTSGTWMFDERDVHIRNTEAYNTWQYYSDTQYYGVKAFAAEVTENAGGRPFGNIYELHYKKDREAVARSSFNARTVDIAFKPDRLGNSATRTFDVAEYSDNFRSIVNRYGEVRSIRHNLSAEDDAKLAEILSDFQKKREEEAEPASPGAFVREMVKTRFHGYGYTNDDMVFTTPEDADAALKHQIPVYILHPDNTAKPVKTPKGVADAVYNGKMFGMNGRDKKLLGFYKAGNTIADLPFSHAELSAIFHLALDRGKENIEDEQQRKVIDNVIHVLDTVMFSDDGRGADELELDRELDAGAEQ